MKTSSVLAVVLFAILGTTTATAQVVGSAVGDAPESYDSSSDVYTSFAEADSPATCDCEQGCCTCKDYKKVAKKVAKACKPVFYNNDFSYLCDPCYDDWHLGENLKRRCVGCDGNLDIGGQFRLRYHNEHGMKGERFRDINDSFALGRLRLYADYHMNDTFRFYVEGIYADSYGESEPVRGTDVNDADLLNAFVDVNISYASTVRVGRQELIYGAQRTVSPLDWANTRRTFEGIKFMHEHCDWSIDAFFTNFVAVAPRQFDEADYDQPFYGVYAVYDGLCDATLDLYYLGYDHKDDAANHAFSYHTFGARLNGSRCDWLYEIESAYQAGSAAGIGTGDQSEGFVTVGLGRKLACHCWDPTIWFYLDYASENYNQLFPLAHKYLGFIDAVQRSNVISPNVLLQAKPSDRLSLLAWYYHFQAASDASVPSIGGTPPQNTGRHYGDEIDLLAKYKVNARNTVVAGYSHFWKGNKITNADDADFVYAEWTVNF